MKHRLLPLGALLIAGMYITGCGPSQADKEAARADSARMADSIAHAQEQIAAQIAEQARVDSLEQARQDSIAKIEKIKEKVPSLSRLLNNDEIAPRVAYLKGLGYRVSKKGKYNEDTLEGEERTTCKYELDSSTYILVVFTESFATCASKISIVGLPEILEKMKSEATAAKPAYLYNHSDCGGWMQIKGNSIEWGFGA